MYKRYNQLHVILEVDPQYLLDPVLAEQDLRPSTNGQLVPLAAVAKFKPSNTYPVGQPPGPVPRRDHFLQPGAGRVARRRPPRSSSKRSRNCRCPSSVLGSFQGTAQVFRASMANTAAAAGRGAARRLYRAGHALREPDPSAHHPLHPALGRRRRPARAHVLRLRPVPGLLHRHHPADGHREEERHHDDRLRPRRRARREAQPAKTPSTRPASSGSGPS